MTERPVHEQWTPSGLPPSLLEQVLGALGEGVVVRASNGRLVAHNRAAEVILGVTADQLRDGGPLPPPWRAFREDGQEIPNEDHPESVALRTGTTVDGLLMRIERLDGSPSWIQVTSRPVAKGNERFSITTFADVTPLRESERDVEQLVRRDPLTALATRLTFEQLLEAAVARAGDGGHRAAVIALGIDHFSLLNQRLGAVAGDEVLVETSDRLGRVTDPGHALARIGDDQFCVLIEPAGPDSSLMALAREIRAVADASITLGDTDYIPSITIGIAAFPSDAPDAGGLLAAAVEALGAAKRLERGSVLFFHEFDTDPGLHYIADQGIRKAIDLGGVRLFYQPVVSVETGHSVGVEALFRLEDPTAPEGGSGMLTPEILGALGPRIASHVIHLLREDARRMHAAGEMPRAIAVNLTALDLLIPRIKEEAAAAAMELTSLGSRLVVEISEQVGLRDPSLIRPVLEELRAASASISLDDFGTGTNSLALLRELPLNSLKLDSSFLVGAMANPIDRSIITATVALAEDLGLVMIAEGVESQEILDFVREQGIRFAQGYFFDHPSPMAAGH